MTSAHNTMRFFARLLIQVVVVVGGVGAFEHSDVGAQEQRITVASPAPVQFQPQCATPACRLWAEFRRQRPFPLQTVATAPLDGRLVMILTEPAIPRARLESTLRELFGNTLVAMEPQRWMIGADGWLQDLLVTLSWDDAATASTPLRNQLFRDRVSLLAEELWGTSFGMYVEDATAPWKDGAQGSAPNLDVHPTELRQWLRSPSIGLRDVYGVGTSRTLLQLDALDTNATFLAGQGDLVVFRLVGKSIARGDISASRASFREFAVLSDAIIGAIWSDRTGNLTIVGRARQVPVSSLPPLRFETFQTLIAQTSNSLSQSYERNLPFAGKLLAGQYAGADWAPIYLSDDLIDTEYGALLNITDQMLKSWSEGGDTQYLYFDYPARPAPGRFVFGAEPLSRVLKASQVLFNWNTAGAGAIVSIGGVSALTPTRTGALPVTYGSELAAGAGMQVGGQRMREYEDNAYRYFAQLGDPNLARVLSYATLFQVLRANPNAVVAAGSRRGPTLSTVSGVGARSAAGMEFLKQCAMDVLTAIEADRLPDGAEQRMVHMLRQEKDRRLKELPSGVAPSPALEDSLAIYDAPGIARRWADEDMRAARRALSRFEFKYPRFSNHGTIARLLVDRAAFGDIEADLARRVDALERDIEDYKRQPPSMSRRDSLIARRRRLDQEGTQLDSMWRDVEPLRRSVRRASLLVLDNDPTRAGFVRAHSAPSTTWIRTPSIVVSWNERQIRMVGGHNIDARALRVEVSSEITSPTLIRTTKGPVLRVPPRLAGVADKSANQIARLIEHGRVSEAALTRELQALEMASATAPVRTRAAALQLTSTSSPVRSVSFIRPGSIADLPSVRQAHVAARARHGDAPVLLVRGDDGAITVSWSSSEGVRCCTRAEDFASVKRILQAAAKDRADIVLENFSAGQARALAMNLSGNERSVVVEALASGGGGGGKPPGDFVHFIMGAGDDAGRGAGRGARGSDGGRRGAGGRGAEGGGGESPRLLVAVESRSSRRLTQAATRPRQLGNVSRMNAEEAAQEAMAAGVTSLPPGETHAFRISSRSLTGETENIGALAVIDPARAAEVAATVERALTDASRKKSTLKDFTKEVKDAIRDAPNRSALRELIIWARESWGSFYLSDRRRAHAQDHRGS